VKKGELKYRLMSVILLLISLALSVLFGALVWFNQQSITMELERHLSMIASWGVIMLLVGVWGVHRSVLWLYTRNGVCASRLMLKLQYAHLLLAILCMVAFVVFQY
jgi:hypothetical protein